MIDTLVEEFIDGSAEATMVKCITLDKRVRETGISTPQNPTEVGLPSVYVLSSVFRLTMFKRN
jgi:hypothetical protein